MDLRKNMLVLLLCLVVSGQETPQGLVSKEYDKDLIAEASQTNPASQSIKREASLLNSYGEPLPPDAYGPPQELAVVTHFPIQNGGDQLPSGPPGIYGPPSPVSLPSVQYEGPPPPAPRPHFPPPKLTYHTPKHKYNPKQNYPGPKFTFKKNYGLKQGLPKPNYGAPFKPKFGIKPVYTPHKLHTNFNSVSKPIYGPPKPVYGPPQEQIYPEVSAVTVTTNIGSVQQDFGLNLPAPIYGSPLSLPLDLKPNFPVPSEAYGPPGVVLGPIGPEGPVGPDNSVGPVHPQGHQSADVSVVEYGPPQPDPDPRPPHPGIPAPPTPPHVVYDGWKPIPGLSPGISPGITDQGLPNLNEQQFYSIDSQSSPIVSHDSQFAGYSSVHQAALSDVDLRAITGGEANHIDQANTVFEAHYTDSPQADLNLVQAIPEKPDSYSVAQDSLNGGPYPSSIRAQGAKLLPPSGIYGVPPGGEYGLPPLPPAHLPLPYGAVSGGPHHTHGWPKHPIKFREPVPHGLLEHVGHTTHGKDQHGIDHLTQGLPYVPPPIRDVKDNHHNHNSVALSIELSDMFSLPHTGSPLTFQQPSTSYGSPIDSYSVPLLTVGDHTASGSSTDAVTTTIDGSILANLSNLDAAAILKHCPYHEAIIKAAKAGEKIPADLAAKYIASLNSIGNSLASHDLATSPQTIHAVESKYNKAKSLREIGKKDKLKDVSEEIYKTSEKIKSLSEETKRLQQKIAANNQHINNVNRNNVNEIPIKGQLGSYSLQIQSSNGKENPSIPHEQLLSEGLLQSILQAIEQPTSGQIVQTHSQNGQNIGQFSNQFGQTSTSSVGQNQHSVGQTQNVGQQTPHYVVAQSVTQSVAQNPQHSFIQTQNHQSVGQNHNLGQSHTTQVVGQTHTHQSVGQTTTHSFGQTHQNVGQTTTHTDQSSYLNQKPLNINDNGLILPAGYEPVDRSKKSDQDTQSSNINLKKMLKDEIIHKNRGDIPECELKALHYESNPPNYEIKPVEEDTNEVAVYFKRKSDDKNEPVTEISVATSISDNLDNYNSKKKTFGEKIKKI